MILLLTDAFFNGTVDIKDTYASLRIINEFPGLLNIIPVSDDIFAFSRHALEW
jgi:hypothetical protein